MKYQATPKRSKSFAQTSVITFSMKVSWELLVIGVRLGDFIYLIQYHTILYNNRTIFKDFGVIENNSGMVPIQCRLHHGLCDNSMHGTSLWMYHTPKNGKASTSSVVFYNENLHQHGIDLSSTDSFICPMQPLLDTTIRRSISARHT